MSGEFEDTGREAILSQEETDMLLQGIEDGSVKTATGQMPPGEAVLYDFAECEKLARGSMPTLQIINTRIARRLRDSLSELLHRPVAVAPDGNDARRYGDHMPTLPLPACLNLVRLAPLDGAILIVPEPLLIRASVDCFFGGKGKIDRDSPPREFTQVEGRMVSLLLERVFAAIASGWEPVLAIKPELIGQEQNPQLAAIASSNDPVIVTRFTVGIAEEDYCLELIMPRALLEPVDELLESMPRGDSDGHEGRWQTAMRVRLEETQLGLRSALTHTTLRLGDVLSLQAGDIIPVDLPDQVMLEAAGTPLFTARIGVSRNRNAVEIVATTNNSPSRKREKHS